MNLTPAGFGDKVAWEAMSCGRPCLGANHDFRDTLGGHAERLFFCGDEDLAAKIAALRHETPASEAAMQADAGVIHLVPAGEGRARPGCARRVCRGRGRGGNLSRLGCQPWKVVTPADSGCTCQTDIDAPPTISFRRSTPIGP